MDCNIWFSMTPRNVWSAQLQIECWACLTLLLLADKSNRSKTSVSSKRELTFLLLESRKYTCHSSLRGWIVMAWLKIHSSLESFASPRLNRVNTSPWASFLSLFFSFSFLSRELHSLFIIKVCGNSKLVKSKLDLSFWHKYLLFFLQVTQWLIGQHF